MQNRVTNLILAVLLLSQTSCCPPREMKECLEFPDKLYNYYPYDGVKTLRFSNLNNDTLAFSLNSFYIVSNTSTTGTLSYDCDDPELYFGAESTDSMYLSGHIRVDEFNASLSCVFSSRYSYPWDNFAISTQNLFDQNNTSLFGDTVVMNKKDYVNRINQVTIVKGEGLVSFYDTKDSCLWRKLK